MCVLTVILGLAPTPESTQSPREAAVSDEALIAGLDALVAAAFAPAGAGGVVLVARDDRVLFRRAYGYADRALAVPMRPEHVLGIGSITKEFTGAAILRLVGEGRIALDADVRTYVPDFNTHGTRVTVEQVLTHTAGLPNIVDLPAFETLARQPHSVEALLRHTRDVPLHFEPGTAFRYSDTGYFLLGAILEKVTGRTYAEYIERDIAQPLGMSRTHVANDRVLDGMARGYVVNAGLVSHAPYIDMTVPYAAGAIVSTVDDLFTWHRALRAGTVIPRPLLERAWEGRALPNGVHSGYGFGFKTCRIGDRRSVSHGGFVNGFGAQALMLRDEPIDAIVLVNNQSDVPDAGGLACRIARYLATGQPTPPAHTLTAAERRRLVGRYQIAPGDVREIAENGEGLFSRRNGQAPTRLTALSPTALTLDSSEGDYALHVTLGTDGRASRMDATLGCEPVDVGHRLP